MSPDSLSADLPTGGTETQLLHIENLGEADLAWLVDIAHPSERISEERPAGLEGIDILHDRAHGSSAISNWSILVDDLMVRGATVTSGTDSITGELLAPYDILWLNTCTAVWSPDEAATVAAWVEAGGRVLMTGYSDEAVSSYNAILGALGAGIEFSTDNGWSGNTTNIHDHAITEGVGTVRVGFALASLGLVESPADSLVDDYRGDPSMACSEVGSGRIVAFASRSFSNYYVNYGHNRLLATRVFEWLAGRPGWLSAEPDDGVLIPGESVDVSVKFDAARLTGADYAAEIVVASDDPDEPEILVPARLHVTSAADISVPDTTLVFGEVFVGGTAADTLLIENDGMVLLTVFSVTSDDPDYFATPSGALYVGPDESQEVVVTYAPSVAGPGTATLTIASDDPDEPEVYVSLSGSGLDPPVIGTLPDSLDSHLLNGEAEDQVLTIENIGACDLEWELQLGTSWDWAWEADTTLLRTGHSRLAAVGTAGTPRGPSGRYADLSEVYILWDRSHGEVAMNDYWYGIRADLDDRGAHFRYGYDGPLPDELIDRDIVWINDCDDDWSASELASLRDWVREGGGLILHKAEGTSVDAFNAILAEVGAGIEYSAANGTTGFAGMIYPHSATSGVGSVRFDRAYSTLSAVGQPASVLVRDGSMVPNIAVSTVGLGRVLAIAGEFLEDDSIVLADNRHLANQAFDWLAGRRWLWAAPRGGIIPAGSSEDVTVSFAASYLAEWDYGSDILLLSNDPVTPELCVPVELHAEGIPDAQLSDTAIGFGGLFVGATATEALALANHGLGELSVTDVTSDHPDFSGTPSSFTVPPTNYASIDVSFAPTSVGPVSATLTITCDDPDTPILEVGLSGEGVAPPIATVAPDSLYAALLAGETDAQTLTIGNSGVSDLEWSIRIYRSQLDPTRADQRSDLRGVSVLWDASHNPQASFASWSVIAADLTSRGAEFTENTDPVTLELLEGHQVIWIIDCWEHWTPDELSDLAVWFAGGGSVLIEGDSERDAFNEILLALGAGMHYGPGGGSGPALNIYPHETTEGVSSIYLPSAHSALAGLNPSVTLLVDGPSGDPNTACREIGGGRIVAMADELLTDSGIMSADNRLFGNQLIDWLVGPNWLDVEPHAGTVVSGDSVEVAVTFDAGAVFGGDYLKTMTVTTNDPYKQKTDIPVRLHVTGTPDIAVADTLIWFGNLEVGSIDVRTLVVANDGTDVLTVSNVSADHTDFAVEPASAVVPPEDSASFLVTFTPTSEGPISGTLTVESDDPDEGTVYVGLSGVGVVTPDVWVPLDAPTIQAAIDMSGPTGRILVVPGVYDGEGNRGLNFHGRNIELVSGGGSGSTYIVCDGEDRGFQFTNGEGPGALVRGFTIVGGDAENGGGMYIEDASPTIEDCVFLDCYADEDGAGVFMTGSSSSFSGCEFVDNTVGWGGGGGMAMSASSPGIDGCLFMGNVAMNEGGAGIACASSSNATITGCRFVENSANLRGGAIDCSNSSPSITGCTMVANSALLGSGIGTNAASPTVTNTILAFGGGGGAVTCGGASAPELSHCCVFGNVGGDSLCGAYHDNLFLDPLLCDPLGGATGLCQNSVCLPGGNPWGELIGALGEACGECTATDVSGDVCAVPVLHPPVPNPFTGVTTIRFEVPLDAVRVGLSVFNVRGERVLTLGTGAGRGLRSVTWNGRDSLGRSVASGVYFLRLEVDGRLESRKMLILR